MQILKGIDLIHNKGLELKLDNGKIISSRDIALEEVEGQYLSPCLIDQQVNGYSGIDLNKESLEENQHLEMMEILFAKGITRILPTIVTASSSTMENEIESIVKAREKHQLLRFAYPAIHIEGPWISPDPGARGAHQENHIQIPNPETWKKLQDKAQGLIRYVTLAPEVDGALRMIEHLKQEGVIVALGHHKANAEQISDAIKAGASLVTHFGNGCEIMQHRHQSPLWSMLAEDKLNLSIIPDGYHLPKSILKCAFQCKGKDKLLLTSDCSTLSGLPAGEYNFLNKEVIIEENGHIHVKGQEILFGSSISQKEAVEHMVRVGICDLQDAMQMASINQASLFNLDIPNQWEVGQSFDGMLFSFRDGFIFPEKVYLEGQKVI